eukprot:TRINITY_DN1566_c0_g2_i11.p1 TRINITY_DN1566_c0_g2~~TRINITY_DN1566_c0_g2_i11.p1  ORF type:complete len:247 (-),score=16.88 TRINITY_DN1566_c0_g2_i11:275-1015(-)
MEEGVAGPEQTSNKGNISFLDAERPGAFGFVGRERVKDVSLEDPFVALQLLHLLLGLRHSEVLVHVNLGHLLFAQALEDVVQSNFVYGSEFVGSLRHYMAILFNLMNHKRKPVQFGKVLGNLAGGKVNGLRVQVDRLLVLVRHRLQYLLVLPRKEGGDFLGGGGELGANGWERGEGEAGVGPVQRLLRKALVPLEPKTQRYVVVLRYAFQCTVKNTVDPPPEKNLVQPLKLFEFYQTEFDMLSLAI